MNRTVNLPSARFESCRAAAIAAAVARAKVARPYKGDPDTEHLVDLTREAWEQDADDIEGLDELGHDDLDEVIRAYRRAYDDAVAIVTIRAAVDVDAIIAAGEDARIEVWSGAEERVRDVLYLNSERRRGDVYDLRDDEGKRYTIEIVRVFGASTEAARG